MKTVLIRRFRYLKEEILGNLIVFDASGRVLFECKTLELAYKDNQTGVSCVPVGEYDLQFEYSPKFKRHIWELKNVPGRSEAKIHVANFYRQLQGCIAVGDMHVKIDADEYPDVRNSGNTLDRFHAALADDTIARIQILGKA